MWRHLLWLLEWTPDMVGEKWLVQATTWWMMRWVVLEPLKSHQLGVHVESAC